ncbi:MAG: LytTR family DNA-binding domain-containing protein [Eubacterium sp.]|nr:LytTR family DNA-binding domain-containing protein [Eubacterium sp.]
MLYIAICDDDEKMLEMVKTNIILLLKEKVLTAEITAYVQSRAMQYDIQEGKFFDLILCDIEMPDIDGMKLSADMKNYLPDVLIIFITAHLQYAIDAFELSIFRYIPKDSFKVKFRYAFEDAVQMIQMQSDQYYIVQIAGHLEKIRYHRILYIYREGKYAVITLMGGSTVRVRKTLAQVYKELAAGDFAYASRGDIVNLSHVMGIIDNMIEMEDGKQIWTSHTKLEQVKEQLIDFWGEQV